MTGLLDPEAERDQPQDAARRRWHSVALVAGDFVGSVILGAVAIWGVVVTLTLCRAFVVWSQPEIPEGWTFRAAIIIAAMLEVRRRWKGRA